MRGLFPLLIFAAFTLASHAARAAKPPAPPPEPEPKPKPKKEPKPGPGKRRPFKMEFTVRVQWPESMFVNEKDIKAEIEKKSQIGPGKGPPEIYVKEHPIGYRIRIEWPDSYGTITPKDAKILIESQHKRLYGRVSDVKVTRK